MAWTLAALYAKHKGTVTLIDLMETEYANGIPNITRETAEPVWDLQKWGGVNLIDCCPWPHQLEAVTP